MNQPVDDAGDDRALLQAHLDGDPDAFGTLFARHRDRLWAVALRTTGDPEEAADALQDALVSAFRRAGSYRGDAAVTTWLHRIVVNACLDRLRRRTVRRAEPLPDDLGERGRAHEVSAPSGQRRRPRRRGRRPGRGGVDGERRAAVLAALETLPPDQRAALVLVDMEGYSVEETAADPRLRPGHGEEPLLARAGPAAAAPPRAPPRRPGPTHREPRSRTARPTRGRARRPPGRRAPFRPAGPPHGWVRVPG